MPIVRDTDPNIGCLAVPLSGLGAFVLATLLSAGVGAGAQLATVFGLIAAVAGAVAGWAMVRGS